MSASDRKMERGLVGRASRAPAVAAVLAGLALVSAGCQAWFDPFLDVPEWKTVRYGDEDPDSPIAGVTRMTPVEEREYSHYVRSVSRGQVVAREARGDWIYYAVTRKQFVQMPAEGQGRQPRIVQAVLIERCKARQPPAAPPPKPYEMPERPTTPTTPAVDKKQKEQVLNKIERNLPTQ